MGRHAVGQVTGMYGAVRRGTGGLRGPWRFLIEAIYWESARTAVLLLFPTASTLALPACLPSPALLPSHPSTPQPRTPHPAHP